MSSTPPPAAGYLSDAVAPKDPDAHLRETEATLHIRYTDGYGKVTEGDIRNQILTIQQKWKIDLERVRMSGGVPPEAMSARAYSLLYAVCWLNESIIDGPSWAKNLAQSRDEELISAIWDQVSRHEACFSGRGGDSGEGKN